MQLKDKKEREHLHLRNEGGDVLNENIELLW